MAEFTFNPIAFTLDEIVEMDNMNSGITELKSGLYQVEIKQASLKKSQNTNAHAISFLVDILKDKEGSAYGIKNQEISIWFLKADGTPIDFGAKKIGSLLYLCGLPTQITGDCFTPSNIIIREYNNNTGKYEDATKQGLNFKALVGKKIWALIALKYEVYNSSLLKKYDFDSFYNDNYKSVSEIKANKDSKKWENRLKWVKSVEESSYEKNKFLDQQAQIAAKNEAGYNPYDYSSQNYYETEQRETKYDGEIPF